LSSLGETLRSARQSKGLTTEQVSEAIHINPSYLSALEEERLDEFPAEVYARGFLRSYASFLGLDPAPLLDEFHALRHPPGAEAPPSRRRHRPDTAQAPGISEPASGSSSPLFPYARAEYGGSRHRPIGIALAVIAFVIILMLGYARGAGYLSSIGARLRRHSAAAPIRTAPPVIKRPSPKAAPVKFHGAPVTLSLHFTGFAYVNVKTDAGSNPNLDGLYQPGQHQTWKGRKLVTLYADRGNDVTATLNGKSLGPLAHRARKVWYWFKAGPNNTAAWGIGKPAAANSTAATLSKSTAATSANSAAARALKQPAAPPGAVKPVGSST